MKFVFLSVAYNIVCCDFFCLELMLLYVGILNAVWNSWQGNWFWERSSTGWCCRVRSPGQTSRSGRIGSRWPIKSSDPVPSLRQGLWIAGNYSAKPLFSLSLSLSLLPVWPTWQSLYWMFITHELQFIRYCQKSARFTDPVKLVTVWWFAGCDISQRKPRIRLALLVQRTSESAKWCVDKCRHFGHIHGPQPLLHIGYSEFDLGVSPYRGDPMG